ncbi:amidase [Brevibacterium sp. S111]|uniref:amidase n=1 Tax=unclassified Brevibacterium TaxID=2614124 RepID=UPI0010806B21|nr:amidase [Brevibacterium sp. S111]TGD12356.1 amidase [Brevibacterium sp. S111]
MDQSAEDEPSTSETSAYELPDWADRLAASRRTLDSLRDPDSRARGLNAIVDVDASRVDETLIESAARRGSPLAGRIVAIKDMIDVAGIATRCGSDLCAGEPKSGDAEVVAELRRSGAIVGVKTTTHEFAYGPTGDVTNSGPVLNPHDDTRMAGGSSAGSAALLGEGSVDLALGTDTGGSGRTPAAFCGVYGLRPTSNSLSSVGVFPLSKSLDTVSPMAGSAEGLSDLWTALTGEMTEVPAASARLTIAELEGGQWSHLQPEVAEAIVTVRSRLAEMGHRMTRRELPETARTIELYDLVQGAEAAAVHSENMADHPELFQPEVRGRLESARKIPGWQYVNALEELTTMREHSDGVFGGADILLCATTPVAAPPVGARADFAAGRSTVREVALHHTIPFSVLGLPAVNIPVWGAGRPLPVGVQLISRSGNEGQLLALAEAVGDLRCAD